MRNEPSRVAGFGAAFLRGIIRASRRQAGSPPLPTQESLPLHTGFAVLWQKPAFYGHPTLSTWFTSEYKKSDKKLDMGKGCVRFKSLDEMPLSRRTRLSRPKTSRCGKFAIRMADTVWRNACGMRALSR